MTDNECLPLTRALEDFKKAKTEGLLNEKEYHDLRTAYLQEQMARFRDPKYWEKNAGGNDAAMSFYTQMLKEHVSPWAQAEHAFNTVQSAFKESIGVRELTDPMDVAKSRTCEEHLKELLIKKADKAELSSETAFLASILLQQDDLRKGALLMLDMLLIESPGQSLPFHNWTVFSTMTQAEKNRFGPHVDSIPFPLYPQRKGLDLGHVNRANLENYKLQCRSMYGGEPEGPLSRHEARGLSLQKIGGYKNPTAFLPAPGGASGFGHRPSGGSTHIVPLPGYHLSGGEPEAPSQQADTAALTLPPKNGGARAAAKAPS